MMNRVTKSDQARCIGLSACGGGCETCPANYPCYTRLSVYEDTGLEPHEIIKMQAELSALRDEITALHEAGQPLTLDELRQMNGEPVWIVEYPDWGHWELSENAVDYLDDRDEDFYSMMHDDPAGKYGLHALGWIAYRQKPAVPDQEGVGI